MNTQFLPTGHTLLLCLYVPVSSDQEIIIIIIGAGIAQYSELVRAGRSGDRVPVRASFSAPVQTGTGAHRASYTRGTGSFLGVKRPGRGVDHPPQLQPKLKKE